ncbi:Zinc finger C2H2 type domain signature [Nakaseomyces glabratus]|nr:Zinc finger C2H2 type domain signature [Nakaseomyces glabratus]KAH7605378.1 Zinc finger C2H2 type domain signature [Nakaseomyces glabratus]KAH7614384.1 Zinc finger C2H2 type domain signature [Nakaseomyces glabratus]
MDGDWGTKVDSQEDFLKEGRSFNIFGGDDIGLNFDLGDFESGEPDLGVMSNDFDTYILDNFLNDGGDAGHVGKVAEVEDLEIADICGTNNDKGAHMQPQSQSHSHSQSQAQSQSHSQTLSHSQSQQQAQIQPQPQLFNDRASLDLLSSPLGEALWKQQEELREALRIQQELNAQVVQKLDKTVEQQEQLQRVLQQQKQRASRADYSLSPALSDAGADKGNYMDYLMADGVDRVDRGENAGGSGSGSSSHCRDNKHNGSPVKRGKYGTNGTNVRVKLDFEDVVSNGAVNGGQHLSVLSPQSSNKLNIKKAAHRAVPYTPKSRVSSMTYTPSTLLTPQPNNGAGKFDNVTISPESVTMSPVIGLGIHSGADAGFSLKPPPMDILPTIPGSTSATPAKQGNGQARGYSGPSVGLSAGPTRANDGFDKLGSAEDLLLEYPVNPSLSPEELAPEVGGAADEYSQGQFQLERTETTLLPPEMSSPVRYSGASSLNVSPVLKSRHVKMSQPGSPVRLTLGRSYLDTDEASDEDEILSSPTKITRKLTTLPRGSIDVYVKELPDRMYECLYPQCGKTFKRRYNIRSHIQTHLEDRPYRCDYDGCDKAFVRNHDLVRHKKTHQEKSYACPCGKMFNREDALAVHRSRMICIGGKKYANVVIKRSPRKRGRPRKEEGSPVKESIRRDSQGQLITRMERQLAQ